MKNTVLTLAAMFAAQTSTVPVLLRNLAGVELCIEVDEDLPQPEKNTLLRNFVAKAYSVDPICVDILKGTELDGNIDDIGTFVINNPTALGPTLGEFGTAGGLQLKIAHARDVDGIKFGIIGYYLAAGIFEASFRVDYLSGEEALSFVDRIRAIKNLYDLIKISRFVAGTELVNDDEAVLLTNPLDLIRVLRAIDSKRAVCPENIDTFVQLLNDMDISIGNRGHRSKLFGLHGMWV